MEQDSHSGMSTEAIAAIAQVKPPSIRERLSRTGSYFGLVPERLPNGRLLWPTDSRERLLESGRDTKPRAPFGPRRPHQALSPTVSQQSAQGKRGPT